MDIEIAWCRLLCGLAATWTGQAWSGTGWPRPCMHRAARTYLPPPPPPPPCARVVALSRTTATTSPSANVHSARREALRGVSVSRTPPSSSIALRSFTSLKRRPSCSPGSKSSATAAFPPTVSLYPPATDSVSVRPVTARTAASLPSSAPCAPASGVSSVSSTAAIAAASAACRSSRSKRAILVTNTSTVSRNAAAPSIAGGGGGEALRSPRHTGFLSTLTAPPSSSCTHTGPALRSVMEGASAA
mmetsp:Transcript_6947/g.15227  ORF Transcript_6947/g.15227 Transcript_6947/m.15227 type:complete len:245 (+) Transcript_6947:842-1576(+)